MDKEQSPEILRGAARIAIKNATEWLDSADRLIAKAEDIENQPKCPTCGEAQCQVAAASG